MSNKVAIQRLPTGVPGLDQVLGGGVPEFSFNLIAGEPGSGKTTLAHQMMFGMAGPQRPALYFTVLGEPTLKMLRYQQQFDFFDAAAIQHHVGFVSLAEESRSGDFEAIVARITAEVRAQAPGLVFIDSFGALMLAGLAERVTDTRFQGLVQHLGMLMASWQATSFLVGEYTDPAGGNPLFTVADGLIWLRQSPFRNAMVRKMEVVKMRGQPTLPGLHTFRISTAGIEVFAPAGCSPPVVMAAPPEVLRERARTGVSGLDEMLGGGLPRGYSLLVAGPSGSGKSLLAASFLAEGARLGETGVIAAFEQKPGRARNPVLAGLLASGQVLVVESAAVDLSIEEVVGLLLARIHACGASRVVIDSLSGFELALAPSFQADFRESLARMVASLARAGVTVLMTSELEDRYSDLRFSPYGTAFLTDAIVVQRYVEVDSRLRRVIAVVKVRASAHSDELRLFRINNDGLHVEQSLPGQEGLLGGRPTRQATSLSSRLPPSGPARRSPP